MIGTRNPGVGRAACRGVEMYDLCSRMNAGIGPAGTAERHIVGCYPAQGLLKCTLNGIVIRLLGLPAVVEATLVGNDKRDATSLKRLITETF